MTDLRQRLRGMFETGHHPLVFRSAGVVPGDGPAEVRALLFRAADGADVRGVFCRPRGVAGALPTVLVLHAHGNRYDIGSTELMAGRPALQAPIGPALAARGIQSVCIDMPCFGARAGVAESAAAKAALWHGRSLAGQMLGESASVLDWLAGWPEVRADRIGVFGISMGATLGYWLSAVDARVRALVQECCLADFATLVETGAHDLHGIYLTVPGLLEVAPNGVIAGLVAPRAQFIGIGEDDPLTPPLAVERALAGVRAGYAAGGRLEVHREPGSGHVETDAMRAAALDFLAEELA